MTTRVTVFSQVWGQDTWDFEADCELAECFPDDDEGLANALRDLELFGEHVMGGGAAPLFKIVPVRLVESDQP